MKVVSTESKSPEDTERLGHELVRGFKGGERVALVGGLGGGKTCFVRGMARGLGTKGYVKSPSFTIINIYEEGRLPLYHIDLYRLKGDEELFETGVEEYIHSNGVCAIEWADRAPDLLDECDIVVRFGFLGENERLIEIEKR
ncbi:MAG: tRNA (adenosine(37)-N6)-threonylcarbamoyltransferase complex ATPase subunit type 1 TsaE [Thermodesulfobacteriota bacterium]|nr:MAG: tRNA (adenosine(37)-N6)-threonylcarbamoyltransferase complex ATPase subunit type 1 TsaE [Thermodesulfobacteriota bacterium]